MGEATIEAVNGMVRIDIGAGWEREADDYTPAEAREFAAQIIAEAEKCEAQRTAIELACADGHAWGSGCNAHDGLSRNPRKVTCYRCQREGCDARKMEPGWIQFAGQLHIRHGRQVDCFGPGCEYCDEENIGKLIHGVIVSGYEELTAEMDVERKP